MNIRQQKYKKYRSQNFNAYRSAIKAGYSHNTAIAAYRNIEKRINFKDFLVKKGIDDDAIAESLNNGLKSTKVISCNVIAPSGEGMADAHSKTQDFIDVPDYQTRHKYLETALKLRGDLKDLPNGGNSVSVVVMQTIQMGDKNFE